VDVLGQSGKMSIFDAGLGKSDPNLVTVFIDFLYEIASDGTTKVGLAGNPKHSIETFANQDFEVFPLEAGASIGSASAQKLSFQSSVNGIGNIKVDTYIAESAGTVTANTESWDVQPSDVKFNIELSNWQFCDPCQDGSSEFIDVGIVVKGKDGTPEAVQSSEGENGMVYRLGGGVPMYLSTQVRVGGDTDPSVDQNDNVTDTSGNGGWQKMASEYPKTELNEDGQTVFVFRFPKFPSSSSVMYDPIIGYSFAELVAADDDGASSGSGSTSDGNGGFGGDTIGGGDSASGSENSGGNSGPADTGSGGETAADSRDEGKIDGSSGGAADSAEGASSSSSSSGSSSPSSVLVVVAAACSAAAMFFFGIA